MVKLSVIIPVYNVEKYIKECLESLLNQSFKEFELIVVDDGSTDNSLSICNEYAIKDKRIVVLHKQNGGVSSARNAALKIIRGDYVTFVDPDDFISLNTYYDNMNYMLLHDDIDCVQYPYCHYYSDLNIKKHILPSTNIKGVHDLFKNWWAGSIISFSLCHKIFKRKVFEEIEFREGHVSEDTCLIPQLCERISNLYISSLGMYYYRQRIDSYTYHYTFDKHIDMFDAHYDIYQMFILFPDLSNEKVIAFTRMVRRLIQAKRENPMGDIRQRQKDLSKQSPSWREILFSTNTKKSFLCLMKLFGIFLFTKINILWLNYRRK